MLVGSSLGKCVGSCWEVDLPVPRGAGMDQICDVVSGGEIRLVCLLGDGVTAPESCSSSSRSEFSPLDAAETVAGSLSVDLPLSSIVPVAGEPCSLPVVGSSIRGPSWGSTTSSSLRPGGWRGSGARRSSGFCCSGE